MALILAGITILEQHLQLLISNPEIYRPERCPSCGCSVLHAHGTYPRHPDRENTSANTLNPIPILRFICTHEDCGKTCSVLPECISPRRWYLWSVQQMKLTLLLMGNLNIEQKQPYPRTIYRWWANLKANFDIHRYHLNDQDSQLGQYATVASFWKALFHKGVNALSCSMAFLNQRGVSVP